MKVKINSKFKNKNDDSKSFDTIKIIENIQNKIKDNNKIEIDIINERKQNDILNNKLNKKKNYWSFWKNNIDKKIIRKVDHKRTKSDYLFWEKYNKIKSKKILKINKKLNFSLNKNDEDNNNILKKNLNFFIFNKKNSNDTNLSKISEDFMKDNLNGKHILKPLNNYDYIKNNLFNFNNYFNNSSISENFYNEFNNLNNNNLNNNNLNNNNFDFNEKWINNKFNMSFKYSINQHLDSINEILFLNHNSLVSCSDDYLLNFYELNNKRKTIFRNSNSQILSMNFNKKNNKLIAGNLNGYIQIYKYRLNSLKLSKNYKLNNNNYSINQIISNNENYIISNGINLFFSNNLKYGFNVLKNNNFKENCVSFLGNNELIIGDQNKFDIFNIEYLFHHKLNLKKFETENNILNIKPFNNKLIFTGNQKGYVNIFDKNQSNKLAFNFRAHQDDITSFILNENKNFFATTSHDCKLRFWDLRNFKCMSDSFVF